MENIISIDAFVPRIVDEHQTRIFFLSKFSTEEFLELRPMAHREYFFFLAAFVQKYNSLYNIVT